MPIYEYEPLGHDCLMCEGRVEVIQDVSDAALEFCPYCGMEVKRVISRASIQMGKATDFDKAAKKGFTTFRRAGGGTWEKVAGEGPAQIVRPEEP